MSEGTLLALVQAISIIAACACSPRAVGGRARQRQRVAHARSAAGVDVQRGVKAAKAGSERTVFFVGETVLTIREVRPVAAPAVDKRLIGLVALCRAGRGASAAVALLRARTRAAASTASVVATLCCRKRGCKWGQGTCRRRHRWGRLRGGFHRTHCTGIFGARRQSRILACKGWRRAVLCRNCKSCSMRTQRPGGRSPDTEGASLPRRYSIPTAGRRVTSVGTPMLSQLRKTLGTDCFECCTLRHPHTCRRSLHNHPSRKCGCCSWGHKCSRYKSVVGHPRGQWLH